MLGLDILDVAIGLVFVYLLLSLILTAAKEGAETFVKTRSKTLERGVSELLRGDKDLLQRFYDHPVVFALYRGQALVEDAKRGRFTANTASRTTFKGADHPSYIPSRSFALAFMHVAATTQATWRGSPWGLAELKAAASTLEPASLRPVLQAALQVAGDDLAKVQIEIEAWYDGAMDRVSGWYKRRSQSVLLVAGVVLAVALNVNTVTIVQSLAQNSGLRLSIVTSAQQATAKSGGVAALDPKLLDQIGLPLGWSKTSVDAMPTHHKSGFGWWVAGLITLLGWVATGCALSLGAPFWFDLLNRLMVVRSTIKPSEKSGDEKSKDPQSAPSPVTVAVEAHEADEDGTQAAGRVPVAKVRPPGDTDVLHQDPATRPREDDDEESER